MNTDAAREHEDLVDDTVRAAALLTRAIGWLRVLIYGGHATRTPAPPASDEQAERRTAQIYVERAEQASWRRLGLAGSDRPFGGPSAAPLDTELVDVESWVRRQVARAIVAAGSEPWDLAGRELVHAIDWLAAPGEVWAVDRAGVARWQCIVASLPADRVRRVLAILQRAGTRTAEATGVHAASVVPFPGGARCPACLRRGVEVDIALDLPRWWLVKCSSPDCVCTGAGCRCGQAIRYEGAAHRWRYSEFEELRRAIPAPARVAVRGGAAGRGW